MAQRVSGSTVEGFLAVLLLGRSKTITNAMGRRRKPRTAHPAVKRPRRYAAHPVPMVKIARRSSISGAARPGSRQHPIQQLIAACHKRATTGWGSAGNQGKNRHDRGSVLIRTRENAATAHLPQRHRGVVRDDGPPGHRSVPVPKAGRPRGRLPAGRRRTPRSGLVRVDLSHQWPTEAQPTEAVLRNPALDVERAPFRRAPGGPAGCGRHTSGRRPSAASRLRHDHRTCRRVP